MSPFVRNVVCLLIVALHGCGACGGPPSELVVEGAHGFVRCLALPLEDRDPWRVGELEFSLSERTLSLAAEGTGLSVAMFSGPGAGPVDAERVQALIDSIDVDLLFLVGGLGDDQEAATVMLSALANRASPTLLMAGGRDDAEIWEESLDELDDEVRDRVIDARGIWKVRFSGSEMVLVSGAPGGRYARTSMSCGYLVEDIEALGDALGESPGARTLLSWSAPSGIGHGFAGLDVGDASMASLFADGGFGAGVFVWPRALVGGSTTAPNDAEPTTYFLERPLGPPTLRADGALGVGESARFTWDERGLRAVISTP